MHFRLGRARPRDPPVDVSCADKLDSTAHLHHISNNTKGLPMPSSLTFGDADFERFSDDHNKPHDDDNDNANDMMASPPELSPMSDPSSDEYESSPEKYYGGNRGSGIATRKKTAHVEFGEAAAEAAPTAPTATTGSSDRSSKHHISPWTLKVGRGGGLFHRSRLSPAHEARTKRREEINANIGGAARGAAMAHADSNRSIVTAAATAAAAGNGNNTPAGDQQDNGFLHILLGEHFASMEKLNENKPDPSAFLTTRRTSSPHPVYSSPTKDRTKAGQNENGTKAKIPPSSSLQRHLAAKINATPPKKNLPKRNHFQHHGSPSSPNHRYRTRWEREDKSTFNGTDKASANDGGGVKVSPYYEACDEVVNRLGIGKPRYVSDSPDRSDETTTGNSSATTAAVGNVTALNPESPIKNAISLYVSPATTATDIAENKALDVVDDTAVRRLQFDLPGGNADTDAGSQAGRIISAAKNGDDGTVSLLTAGSALSSFRKATEAKKTEAKSSIPSAMSSLQRAAAAAATNNTRPSLPATKSSLQMAAEARKQQAQAQPQAQPLTPNRSNVTIARSRSLFAGGMSLGDVGIDTSASLGRFQATITTPERTAASSANGKAVKIATVPAVGRSSRSARGGAGIIPIDRSSSKEVALSESLQQHHTSHRRHERKSSSRKNTVYLLLLDPEQKIFELCSIRYDPKTSTVGTIIDKIRVHATEPNLAVLKYSTLVRPDDGKEFSRLGDDYKRVDIEDSEVLVAVPDGFKPSKCRKIAVPILRDPKLDKLLRRARRENEKQQRESRGKDRSRSKSRTRTKAKTDGKASRGERAEHTGPSLSRANGRIDHHKKTRFADDKSKRNAISSSSGGSYEKSSSQPALLHTSASSSPNQALEERISDLEKRLADSQHSGTRVNENLVQRDVRRDIEERARARAEIEEQVRARVELRAVEESSRPSVYRIEELARRATGRENHWQQPRVHFKPNEHERSSAIGRESSMASGIDDDTAKTAALSAVAAVAIRAAVSAVSRCANFLLDRFAPQDDGASGLDFFIPSLEAPNPLPESNAAFGFAGILALTVFFALLIKMQESIQTNDETSYQIDGRGGSRKKVASLVASPVRNSLRNESWTSPGRARTISNAGSTKGSPDPWGERHCR